MKKLNIILIIVLMILLGSVGFLGFTLFKESKTVKAPSLANASLADVTKWCESLGNNPCKIEFDYSDTIDKDMVIYQSIKEGEKVDDTISFTVSLGKNPSIAIPENVVKMNKEEVIKWATENNLSNITYKEENSDKVKQGTVIRIESSINPMFEDTPVTIVVSSGPIDEAKKNVNGTVKVNSKDYVGNTLSQFESKVKKLGLVPYHNEDRDAYSSSVSKGNIVWHGSGEYVENENITYGVSLGAKSSEDTITVTSRQFTSKTVSDFESAVKELGLVPVKTSDYEDYSDTITKGNIIWHGSGEYEKGENIRYSLSLGKKGQSEDIPDETYVSKQTYQGKTVSEFEEAVKALGLVPSKTSEYEDYSESVSKGLILWHGYGLYEKGETMRYSLSLGKKGSESQNIPDESTIKRGIYVGKSVSDFENTVKALGLVPEKTSDYEDYSDTVVKGYVIWHGSGVYEKGENIRYSLSLGKKSGEISTSDSFYIAKNTYSGKTVSEFETLAKNMGLVPSKTSQYEDYSDTIAKGNIIWHGYGEYEKGETFRYSVSLGKKDSSSQSTPTVENIRVSAGTYTGKTVSDFENAVKALGLVPSKTTDYEDFSDSVAQGNVIWHGSGTYTKGENIRYSLSKGPKPVTSTIALSSFADLTSITFDPSKPTYEQSKTNISSYLSKAGFTNYQISGEKSNDSGEGVLLSVYVNGSKHVSRSSYDKNAQIVIKISTGVNS